MSGAWLLTVLALFAGCAALHSQGAPGPMLKLPERATDAPAGSDFAHSTAGLDVEDRQAAAVAQILAGNVPSWVRKLTPVSFETAKGSVTVFVTPDYVAIGSDDDYLRMPLSLPAAAALCRSTGCLLPTTAIVDAVYQQATIKLAPRPIPPSDRMTSNEVFLQHQRLVQAQFDTIAGGSERLAAGALTAGHKKDLVLCARLTERPGRVAIYGWHRLGGRPIQPLSTVHSDMYADYSHGVRLVGDTAVVNGTSRPLADVLADPDLAPVLSGEGALRAADLLPFRP